MSNLINSQKFEAKMFQDLKNQFDYVLYHSKFYQEKHNSFKEVNSFSVFERLQFTEKSELLLDQERFSPFGNNICVKVSKIKRIHKTSGTTNNPLILAFTEKDILNTVQNGAKCFTAAGVRNSDVVVHCLNYNMWAGGYTDHQSLEESGAAVIPFGTGNSHKLIETIRLIKPTAIHCTPSYLKKLELIIANDFHIRPKELNLRLGLFGAESGLQNPVFRSNIEETWGLIAMNANYGLSDVLSIFGAECCFRKGLHFIGKDLLYPELIHPQTLELIPFENGCIGELVLTNLKKEAQPLIRYRTNDLIKILSVGQCECGQGGFTFEVVGRSDDMIIVKGINVFVNSVEKSVNGFPEINTGMFKMYVNKNDPIDNVHIYLETKTKEVSKQELKGRIIKSIQNEFNFTPEVFLFEEGELDRTEGKTRKLFRTL